MQALQRERDALWQGLLEHGQVWFEGRVGARGEVWGCPEVGARGQGTGTGVWT